MRIEPAVTIATVRQELADAAGLLREQGWHINPSLLEQNQTFMATIASPVDREIYQFEFDCGDYPAMPPVIDPVDIRTGLKGSPSAFPNSHDSFSHPNNVICIQFNRKAYSAFGGPHSEWNIEQWQTLLPGVSSIGEMLNMLGYRLSERERYLGRRAA